MVGIAATPIGPRASTSSSPSLNPNSSTDSFLESHRRSPRAGYSPNVEISSSPAQHTLRIPLPGYAPDMITITAKKHDALVVVADMWYSEQDCHHEWLVNFSPRDADLASVRAQFSPNGMLTISVPRPSMTGYPF